MKHRNLRSRALSAVPHSLVVIALMIFLAAPQIAVGQSQPTFDQVVEAAKAARQSGDLERAAELVKKAYSMRPIPVLMNNLGKIYEDLGRYQEAYECYRTVVNDPKTGPALRQKDQARMAAIEKRLKRGLVPPAARSQNGWAGRFQSQDGMVLELRGSGTNYTGSFSMEGLAFQVQAQVQGQSLVGTVSMDGEAMPFRARLVGNQIEVNAGERVMMTRIGAGGGAALPYKDKSNPTGGAGMDMSANVDMGGGGMNANINMGGGGMDASVNMGGGGMDAAINMGGGGMDASVNMGGGGMGSPVNTKVRASRGGKAKLPHSGFSFNKPRGWVSRKVEEKFVFGHNTKPGMVIVVGNTAKSVAQIQQEAHVGSEVAEGVKFQLKGQPRPFGSNGLAVEFAGDVPGKGPGIAYTVNLVSPHGEGATLLMLVLERERSPELINMVHSIAKSVRFFKPVPYPVDRVWKQKLDNRKLTYMNTTSSSGYDGSYTGSSSKEAIGLCAAGHFTYYSSSSYTVNAGEGVGSNVGSGSTAYGHGKGRGKGQWTVQNKGGKVTLILKFYDGRVNQYHITEDGKRRTYLNGTRYFRTSGNDGPNCN